MYATIGKQEGQSSKDCNTVTGIGQVHSAGHISVSILLNVTSLKSHVNPSFTESGQSPSNLTSAILTAAGSPP